MRHRVCEALELLVRCCELGRALRHALLELLIGSLDCPLPELAVGNVLAGAAVPDELHIWGKAWDTMVKNPAELSSLARETARRLGGPGVDIGNSETLANGIEGGLMNVLTPWIA